MKKKVELALSKRTCHYHNLVLEIETVLRASSPDETVGEGDVDICTTFTCACSTNQRLSDSGRWKSCETISFLLSFVRFDWEIHWHSTRCLNLNFLFRFFFGRPFPLLFPTQTVFVCTKWFAHAIGIFGCCDAVYVDFMKIKKLHLKMAGSHFIADILSVLLLVFFLSLICKSIFLSLFMLPAFECFFALHLIRKRCVHVSFISFFATHTHYLAGGCRPTTETATESEWKSDRVGDTAGMIYLNEIVLPGIWLNSIQLFPLNSLIHTDTRSIQASQNILIVQHLPGFDAMIHTFNEARWQISSGLRRRHRRRRCHLCQWCLFTQKMNDLPSDGIFFWCQYR